MPDPSSSFRLCIVCMGNICRSPIAETVLRSRIRSAGLDNRVVVESAGTGDWHAGEPADDRALAVLHQHGYDGRAHRARQFRPEWFERFDLVLTMDRDNLAHLRALAPSDDARGKIQPLRAYDPEALADGDTDVPDPYFGDSDSFEQVLAMIERAAAGLVDAIGRELGHGSPAATAPNGAPMPPAAPPGGGEPRRR